MSPHHFRATWALPLLLLLLVLLPIDSLAAGEKKKKTKKLKRRGDEGSSGLRCPICQAMILEARRVWKDAKTTKTGSPYNYLGDGKNRGETAEDIVLAALKKKHLQ